MYYGSTTKYNYRTIISSSLALQVQYLRHTLERSTYNSLYSRILSLSTLYGRERESKATLSTLHTDTYCIVPLVQVLSQMRSKILQTCTKERNSDRKDIPWIVKLS
jgi:hypothetical protein